MNQPLWDLMQEWLREGTDQQRAHAKFRLAMPDAAAFAPDGPSTDFMLSAKPGTVPTRDSIRATKLGFRRCLYASHEGCGCTGTHCYRHGRIVGLRDCLDCLGLISKETTR